MYKQTLWGFRRKALPLTILTGLFLLTVSVYEAIWGAAWAGPLVYLAPGLLFCLAALALLALSFLSFEYRLVEEDFFVRALALGRPFRAQTARLKPGQCRLRRPYRPWQALRVKKSRYYLPLIGGYRLCLLEYQSEGQTNYLLFRPSPDLAELMERRLEPRHWQAPEETLSEEDTTAE